MNASTLVQKHWNYWRAAQLARVCAAGCEELSNLKKAIERCPAAGNKFVAAR